MCTGGIDDDDDDDDDDESKKKPTKLKRYTILRRVRPGQNHLINVPVLVVSHVEAGQGGVFVLEPLAGTEKGLVVIGEAGFFFDPGFDGGDGVLRR